MKLKMSDLARISFSLENELLEKLSELVEKEGYENRSEFVRDLIRARLTAGEWEEGDIVIGTLTLIYDHHKRGLTEKLLDLQHHTDVDVLASTHVHLTHHLCAEMIMLKGHGERIAALAASMKKLCGVIHAELAKTTTGKSIAP